MRPIIRWAGSKRQLVPHLLRCTPGKYSRYLEPFAGSACLFFELGPASAVLGDINPDLISMYRQLRRHPIKLHRAISGIPRTPEQYYVERAKQKEDLEPFERAVRFIYLNRNCFNAVYRVNKRGCFNVPWGTHTGALPSADEFRQSAVALRSAELISGDFEKVLALATAGDFVYLDPPYSTSVVEEPGLYGAGAFNRVHLTRLVNAVRRLEEIGAIYLMSFEFDQALIEELLPYRVEEIYARRHVAGFTNARGYAREILLTNARPPQ